MGKHHERSGRNCGNHSWYRAGKVCFVAAQTLCGGLEATVPAGAGLLCLGLRGKRGSRGHVQTGRQIGKPRSGSMAREGRRAPPDERGRGVPTAGVACGEVQTKQWDGSHGGTRLPGGRLPRPPKPHTALIFRPLGRLSFSGRHTLWVCPHMPYTPHTYPHLGTHTYVGAETHTSERAKRLKQRRGCQGVRKCNGAPQTTKPVRRVRHTPQ